MRTLYSWCLSKTQKEFYYEQYFVQCHHNKLIRSGSKGRPHTDQNFLDSMQFLGKFCKIICSNPPPPGGLVPPPPMGNPGSLPANGGLTGEPRLSKRAGANPGDRYINLSKPLLKTAWIWKKLDCEGALAKGVPTLVPPMRPQIVYNTWCVW